MNLLSRAFAGAALASLLAAGSALAAAPVVKVAQGRLSGLELPKADAYLGVPYAQAPVGNLRWKAPASAKTWGGVRKADKAPASCYQVLNPPEGRDPWTPEYLIAPNISEDCLYLNIWAPKNAAGKKLPVLFWIHGGGFTEGSASIPIYDGANLAASDVIVVNVNYRLDVFGFLAHPALNENGDTPGNYGLKDLVAALKWVNANIGAFGGDPTQVTISGQSAGSGAVHDLIGMPSAKGLFARAIAQSGSGIAPRAQPLAPNLTAGEAFAKANGAANIAALRKLPSKAVLDAAVKFRQTPGQGFRAVIDGTVIPKDPTVAQTTPGGGFNDTPILTGYNDDEGSGFEANYGSWPAAEIQRRLDAYGPGRATAIYAPFGFTDVSGLGKQLSRDRGKAFTAIWAKRRLTQSSNPIYLYQFTHPMPGPKSARYGAFHTAEVPFVFRNLIGEGRNYTAVDQKVADNLSGYWLNFIRTGNPNGAGLPNWPAFDASGEQAMFLNQAPTAARILPPQKRDMFEAYVAGGGTLSSR